MVLWCTWANGYNGAYCSYYNSSFTANAALVAKGQAPIFHPIFMTLGIGFWEEQETHLDYVFYLVGKSKSQQLKALEKLQLYLVF